MRTDLGRSVGVTNIIQLMWFNQFTGSQPSIRKICVIKRIHIEKFIDIPPYEDRRPTAYQSGEAIQSVHKMQLNDK